MRADARRGPRRPESLPDIPRSGERRGSRRLSIDVTEPVDADPHATLLDPQPLHLIEQFERERCTGPVHPKVLNELQRLLRPRHRAANNRWGFVRRYQTDNR